MEEVNVAMKEFLQKESLYIPKDKWFYLLQDPGTEMPEADRQQLMKNKDRKKSKNITFGLRYHPNLYQLAKMVHDIFLEHKTTDLKKMTGNASNNIHKIGKFIAGRRSHVARADFYNVRGADIEEFMELVNSADYTGTDDFYFLSQATMLTHFKNEWSETIADVMKITIDDKVRVAVLLLTIPELADLIPYLLDRTKGGDRANMDVAKAKKNQALELLLVNFIDSEVLAVLPEVWHSPETRAAIDSFRGDGTYDTHGHFDPNNFERMHLAWTVKHMQMIVNKFMSEYNTSMDKWTQGTGGGPGAESNYVSWQTRDPTNVSTYTEQDCQLYLTVVYMIDKAKGFLLVQPKDQLPSSCRIEDGDGTASAAKTPSTKNGSDEDQLLAAVQQISSQRAVESREMRDLLDGFRTDDAATRGHDIIDGIATTTEQIGLHEQKLAAAEGRKRAIIDGSGSSSQKKVKLEPVLKDIRREVKLIAALNDNLDKQTRELEKLNGKEDKEGSDDDLFDGISVAST